MGRHVLIGALIEVDESRLLIVNPLWHSFKKNSPLKRIFLSSVALSFMEVVCVHVSSSRLSLHVCSLLFTGGSIYLWWTVRRVLMAYTCIVLSFSAGAPKPFLFLKLQLLSIYVWVAAIKAGPEHCFVLRIDLRIYSHAFNIVLILLRWRYPVFPYLPSQTNPRLCAPKLAPGGRLHSYPYMQDSAACKEARSASSLVLQSVLKMTSEK